MRYFRDLLGNVHAIDDIKFTGMLPDGCVEIAEEQAIPTETFDSIAARKRSEVQAEKCRRRDSGVVVNGVLFDTDLAARVAYSELFVAFSLDPTFTTEWKASGGHWVTMDFAMYQQVLAAGKAHISAAFAWQAGKDAAIDAAVANNDHAALVAIDTAGD